MSYSSPNSSSSPRWHLYLRPVVVLALFLALFVLPWWSVALSLVVGIVVFRRFVEAPIIALCMDLAYSPLTEQGIRGFKLTAAILILFVIIEFVLKKLTRFQQ